MMAEGRDPKEGECGDRRLVAYQDGYAIYGVHHCTRRGCGLCYEDGYLSKKVHDTLSRIKGAIYNVIRGGNYRCMINGKVRRLKVIKYIVSLKSNHVVESSEDLKAARKSAIQILKDAGVYWGIIISHPYRGGGKNDRGRAKREALDRDNVSLHFHGIGLAYYTDWDYYGGIFCEFEVMGIPSTVVDNNKLWGIISDRLSYMIDHAGWIGNGQAIVRFGKQLHVEDQDKPPDPELFYLHPTTGERFNGIEEDGISEMAMNRIYQSIDKYKHEPEVIGLGWEEDGIRFIPDCYAPQEYDMTLVDIWEYHLARMCEG
jgi:hypothetical protein